MFIGREKELELLEGAYSAEGCKFFVIQGERSAGKTTLIEEFCRNKNAITFSPVSISGKTNMAHFSWLVLHHYNDSMHSAFQFWEDALNYIAGKNERVIIAIDGADMLAEHSHVVMKVFAKVLSSTFEGKNILLIFSCKDIAPLRVTGLMDKAIVIHLEKFLNEKTIDSLKREELKRTDIGRAKFIQVSADTVIIREGEINTEMYKIISGRAICHINHGTDDEYLLGSLNEQKTFGEYSLLTGSQGIYTVTAYSDMLLLKISRSDFEDFIQMSAANSVNIMQNMAAMMKMMKVNINMLNGELQPKE